MLLVKLESTKISPLPEALERYPKPRKDPQLPLLDKHFFGKKKILQIKSTANVTPLKENVPWQLIFNLVGPSWPSLF